MATEYTVLYNNRRAGTAGGGGTLWENQTEAKNKGTKRPIPEEWKCVTVSAGSEQEAATGVRKAYGDGQVDGEMIVIATSNEHAETA